MGNFTVKDLRVLSLKNIGVLGTDENGNIIESTTYPTVFLSLAQAKVYVTSVRTAVKVFNTDVIYMIKDDANFDRNVQLIPIINGVDILTFDFYFNIAEIDSGLDFRYSINEY